jgi:hypothetical protein
MLNPSVVAATLSRPGWIDIGRIFLTVLLQPAKSDLKY